MSFFVDTSAWFAGIVARDAHNRRAKEVLAANAEPVTTDHVMVETWLLLKARYRLDSANLFWSGLRASGTRVEFVTPADLEAAWGVGEAFPDQDFSIVDRTSFAVMERLGISRVASFANHFAVYRYGRKRDKAFEVLR